MFNSQQFANRAKTMADWLLSIQRDDGSFQGGSIEKAASPSVFNTGQIILGLKAMYDYTKEDHYLDAAVRACTWLCTVISHNGAWNRFSYNGIAHTYYVRVGWALLQVYQATGSHQFRKTAELHYKWVLSQGKPGGWYANNAFESNDYPITHTVVYVVEGLLGGYAVLGNEQYLTAAQTTIDALTGTLFRDGALPGEHNETFTRKCGYQCLVGNAQLAAAIFSLPPGAHREKNLPAAVTLNGQLMTLQHLNSKASGVYGGISGSFPVWGRYQPLSFPNWAAKYFADALMEQMNWLDEMHKSKL